MLYRKLFRQVSSFLEHKNVLIITGLRQVGKTTLLKQLYDLLPDKPRLMFDFGNPLDTMIFENIDYNRVYDALKYQAGGTSERLYVFIDEIQNFPAVTMVIKYLVDHYGVKFCVTGSSDYYLKNLFPESLSGRKFLFQLHPMGFQEFLYFKGKLNDEQLHSMTLLSNLGKPQLMAFNQVAQEYAEFLEFGGFPEVVLTKDPVTKTMVLKNIFASFFEKDLKILSDYKDVRDLRNFILLLATKTGSMLDITKLSSETGINRMRIYEYLALLQGIFLIRLLPTFSKTVNKSVAGGKKVYFCDTGLLQVLSRLHPAQVLENAVVNQLSAYGSLCFYHKRNTAEIDVILDQQTAFEIKTTGSRQDIDKLRILSAQLGISEYYLVSLNFRDHERLVLPMSL